MSENKLLDLSFEFAVVIVELCDCITMPKSSYMTDQLSRAGTSVGANIHEAQYAHSKKDFIAKLEIALKEANETSYWLKLMHSTQRINDDTYKNAEKLCGSIRRLLIASCKTAKESFWFVIWTPKVNSTIFDGGIFLIRRRRSRRLRGFQGSSPCCRPKLFLLD